MLEKVPGLKYFRFWCVEAVDEKQRLGSIEGNAKNECAFSYILMRNKNSRNPDQRPLGREQVDGDQVRSG